MKFVVGMNATIAPGSVPAGLEGYDPAEWGNLSQKIGTITEIHRQGTIGLFGWHWHPDDVKPLV